MTTGLLKRHGEDVREVALLTPYRAQLGVLRRAAQRELDEQALLTVTFATVDGFQVDIAVCRIIGRRLDVQAFAADFWSAGSHWQVGSWRQSFAP